MAESQVPPGGPGMFTDQPTDRELYGYGLIEVPSYGGRCTNCGNGNGGYPPPIIDFDLTHGAPAPLITPVPVQEVPAGRTARGVHGHPAHDNSGPLAARGNRGPAGRLVDKPVEQLVDELYAAKSKRAASQRPVARRENQPGDAGRLHDASLVNLIRPPCPASRRPIRAISRPWHVRQASLNRKAAFTFRRLLRKGEPIARCAPGRPRTGIEETPKRLVKAFA